MGNRNKRTQITLGHLNEFYPYIRKSVIKNFSDAKIDLTKYNEEDQEKIIIHNIQLNTNKRMKNQKEFKKELQNLGIINAT